MPFSVLSVALLSKVQWKIETEFSFFHFISFFFFVAFSYIYIFIYYFSFDLFERYDRWNVTGWSGDDVWPYYAALENYTGLPEAANHNTSGPIQVAAPTYTALLTAVSFRVDCDINFKNRKI